MRSCEQFGLAEAELLQLINLHPTEPVEVYLVKGQVARGGIRDWVYVDCGGV
jgi:hypothetical protein